MAEALAARHMGWVVRAYRCHPWHGHAPVPQEVVGDWLGMAQVQMSRLENGPPRKHLDWLTFVARTLRIPADRLWFRLDSDDHGDAEAVPEAPTLAPRVPNDLIRQARLARRSPSGSGRALSRQELAEAVNALVFATCGRRTHLDASYIGKLKRGETQWPLAHVRAGLRGMLGAHTDAEIGLFIIHGAGRPADVTEPPAPAQHPQAPSTVAQAAGPVSRAEVAEARRALGRLLAAWREASGMTQTGLAQRVPWSRSTVANVELGRQNVPRNFWQGCEEILGARGALLAASEHVDTLAARHRAQAADENTAQRLARWAPQTGESGRTTGSIAGPVPADPGWRGEPPTLHLTVSAGASLTIAFGETGPGAGQPIRVVVSAADEPHEIDRPSADDARVYSMAAWRGRG